ncbi:YciI family protein [Rhodococcus sp. NPDC059234]|uniref:YciI family protein n=1 Tax=Rhodococcus sp. NPDC059234 TaxID=3346781 RepID=UPI00366F9552
MKYLLIMQIDSDVLEALTKEEMAAVQKGHGAFMDETRESGEFIGTQALGALGQGALIRVEDGAQRVVTDGPYAEAKEFMGGYYMVDVESKERAIELARSLPDASIPGLAVEVRPIMFEAGFDF